MVPGLISAGTTGRTYVKALVGDPDKWQDDAEILRCNPLCSISDRFRDRLLAERDAALKDETLIRKFCAYRLNVLACIIHEGPDSTAKGRDRRRNGSRTSPPASGAGV